MTVKTVEYILPVEVVRVLEIRAEMLKVPLDRMVSALCLKFLQEPPFKHPVGWQPDQLLANLERWEEGDRTLE